MDLGIYCLQFASFVFKDEMPQTVTVSGGILNDDGVDMCVTANLHYKNNCIATCTSSTLVELPNEACVCGDKGMIRVPMLWCPTELITSDRTVGKDLPEMPDNATFNFKNSAGLAYEAAEARACILKGKATNVS